MFGYRPVGEEEVIQKNMALAEERNYTIEFIEALPEHVQAELIDGQIFYMATPVTLHQQLLSFLTLEIGMYLRRKKGPCQLLFSPTAVYLDENTYLIPDLLVVCDKKKLDRKGVRGAPDFVAEILSPSTCGRDCLLKRDKYQKAGVREYWILDGERRTVQVYDFQQGRSSGYSFSDPVPVGIFGDLTVDFTEFMPESD